MKKVLFVSFDLIRDRDPEVSLSIASVMAALKGCERLSPAYGFEHLSVNVHAGEDWRERIARCNVGEYSFVAISAYVWNERHINPLIEALKSGGFGGRVILGGYQITNDSPENYRRRYPLADVFVEGYAEQALLDFFAEDGPAAGPPRVLRAGLRPELLPSPFLTGEIPVRPGMEMVRFETKRGCPYSCTFCRHRDVINDKAVLELDKSRILRELDYFIGMGVKKLNVIDPIFHVGNYMEILREMVSLCKSWRSETLISLQCRLEFLAGSRGREFLDLCGRGRFELEFGLQTCDERESALIDRKNNMSPINKALEMLRGSGIRHEISMIYGLPGQTLDSFARGMEFLREKCRYSDCAIVAYPLMLLPGTPLYAEKEKFGFVESVEEDELGIPHVASSSTFTYGDWLKMREIAESFCRDALAA